MAFTTSWGYTDTNSASPLSVSIPKLNYAADFAVTKDDPTDVVLTNTTSPLNQPETVRWGYQNINNIYSGTEIDPIYYSQSKRGVSVVGQVRDYLSVTCSDSTDGCSSGVLLPFEAHIVFRVPIHEAVTADLVLSCAQRAMATLYDGNTTSSQVSRLLRDALKPATL